MYIEWCTSTSVAFHLPPHQTAFGQLTPSNGATRGKVNIYLRCRLEEAISCTWSVKLAIIFKQ